MQPLRVKIVSLVIAMQCSPINSFHFPFIIWKCALDLVDFDHIIIVIGRILLMSLLPETNNIFIAPLVTKIGKPHHHGNTGNGLSFFVVSKL